jgi:chromosome segregation ATPase
VSSYAATQHASQPPAWCAGGGLALKRRNKCSGVPHCLAATLPTLAQVGDKAEEMAQLRSQAAAAEQAQHEAELASGAAAAAAEECAAALSRAERKLALLGRERDGLQAILASYDEEYMNQLGSELGPQQKRIVEAEAQVAALHAHVRSLEEELGSRSSAAAGASSSAGEAVLRAEAAEARARALEAEAENLGKQVALLQVGAVQWVGVGGMSCCVAAAVVWAGQGCSHRQQLAAAAHN